MLLGYEFFYRQPLENLFTMLSASIPTPIAIFRPRPRSRLRSAIRFSPTPIPRPRSTPEPLLVDVDELNVALSKQALTNQFLSFLRSRITVLH